MKKCAATVMAIAMAVGLMGGRAQGATLTWDANTGTTGAQDGAGTWNAANQWWTGSGNTTWSDGNDAAIGSGGAGGTIALAVTITPSSLTFNSFGGTYTLGTSGDLVLNGNLTMSAAASAVTISRPVTLNAAQTWKNNASGALTVSGGVTNGANLLTVDGLVLTTISSVLGNGAGGLTKNGLGQLTLSALANTYTGTTTVNAGTLTLSGNGTINASTAIAINGGTLNLVNANATDAGRDRLGNGAPVTSNGGTLTFANTSGTVVYSETNGWVTLSIGQLNIHEVNNQAGTGSQTLTLSGLTQSSQAVATFSSASGLNATKNMIKVTGAGATPAGQIIGPWATVGTAAATPTDYGVYDASANILPANIAATGEGSWTTAANAYTMNAAQTLAATRTITALRSSGAAIGVTLGNGATTYSLETYGVLNGGSGTLTISNSGSGALRTPTGGGNLFLTAGNNAIAVSAPITDNGGAVNVVKSGAYALTLSGTNNYTGNTTVNAGTLVANTTSSLPGYNTAGKVVFSGGTLQVPVGGSGWTMVQVDALASNATKNSGALTLDIASGNETQSVAYAAGSFGSLGLTKLGAGTLVLNQTNTHTGRTTAGAGTLRLSHSNAVASATLSTSGGSVLLDTSVNIGTLIADGATVGDAGIFASGANGATLNMTGGTIFRTNKTGGGARDVITVGISGAPGVLVPSSSVGNDYRSGLEFAPAGDVTQALGGVVFGWDKPAGGAGDKGGLAFGGASTGNTLAALRPAGAATYATIRKRGPGAWTFTGDVSEGCIQNYAGTMIAQGTVYGTYTGFGMLGGTVVLDYTAIDADKLVGVLYLNGGTLQLDRASGASGTHTEIVSSTSLSGGWCSLARGSGSTAKLRMNGITRSAGATLNLGAAGIADADTLNTNGLIGGWAAIIVAGADFAYNSTGAGDGTINALPGASYTDVQRLAPGAIANGPTTNVRLIEGSGPGGNITLGATPTTINTLNQSASGGTGAATIDAAGNTLAVNAILAGAGSGALTIGTAAGSGTLMTATASGELILHNYSSNPLTINSVIANNTGASRLTLSGPGTTILAGANTYSGVTFLSGGVMQAVLGTGLSASTYLQLAGGILQSSGTFIRANSTTAGGGNFQWASEAGSGFAARGGKLTVRIGNNPATEQTWAWVADGGAAVLAPANNAILGPLMFGSATADSEVEFQNNINLYGEVRNIDVAAGAGGDFATLSGVIRNTKGVPVGIVKTGAGTLKLTGANTYNGQTLVNAGTLLVNGSLAAASAVFVNGGTLGGTGTVNGAVSVGAAGSVAPGASAGTLNIGGGLDVSAMANGGTGKLKFELDALAATNDRINVTGTLTIGSGVLGFGDCTFTNLGGLQGGTYTLITSSGISGTLDSANTNGAIGTFTGNLQITGNNLELVVIAAADITAPTPDPMVFEVAPAALDGTRIVMTATNATDAESLPVTYFFTNTVTSDTFGWTTDRVWTNTGLSIGPTYGYMVKARDNAGNETLWSATNYAATVNDTNAPTPNPMVFAVVPHALDTSRIAMTATNATDDYTPSPEYFFTNTVNGDVRNWSTSTVWTNTGLIMGQTYGYMVKARDAVSNETDWSATNYAATVNDTNAPTPNPMAFAVAPYVVDGTTVAMTATNATEDYSFPVQYFFTNTSNSVTFGWTTQRAWTNTGLTMFQTYGYKVKARDAVSNETDWSAEALATPARSPTNLYWDGGTTNIPGNGDGVSQGGAGTWNTTTTNWDQESGQPHVAWNNAPNDKAIFGGTVGTVTLAEDISLGGMSFTVASTGYTISSNTLNFGVGGSISAIDNTVNQTIQSAITGSPTVRVNRGPAGNQYEGLIFAPNSGTQTLGVIYLPDALGGTQDKAGVYLSGSTIGNSAASVTFTNASWRYGTLYKQGSGQWTVGNVDVGTIRINGGTLVASGYIRYYYAGLFVNSGGALHYNNAGAVYSSGFTLNGGSFLDNSSGAAITTSTYNPPQSWAGDWTFIGVNGPASDLNLGAGAVTLGASPIVNVSNALTTLTVGGVISHAATPYGLTKAGAGKLKLTGANTYTGPTTVSNGTLVVNGTLGGAGTVTVAGGTLGGTGAVNGAVSVQSGGTVAPGDSTGTFFAKNAGGVAIQGGGILAIEIDDAQTPKCDKLAVTNGLLNVAGATLNLSVTGTPTGTVYVIASYQSFSGPFGATNGLPLGYTLDSAYNSGTQIAILRDTNAPAPSPMGFAVPPAARNGTTIVMTASNAADATPPVEYYFTNTVNANTFGWTTGTIWTNAGLETGTNYGYKVKARDAMGNETAWSPVSWAVAETDTNAPAPNPMTFAVLPAGLTATSIVMTATAANDPSTPVEYYFENTTNSDTFGWTTDTVWINTGLTPGQTYGYRVKARDAVSNETLWSAEATAVAQTESVPPTPDPMTWAAAPSMLDATTVVMTASTATDLYNGPVEYYFENTSNGNNSGWIASTNWTNGGLTTFLTYGYRVKARDAVSNETAWSTPVATVTLQADASGTWNVDASGNWSAPANWITTPPGFAPDGVGSNASLTYDIGADRIVTMDSVSRTLGTLNIGDANNTHRYTLAGSGGATLTLDNGLGTVQINQTAGSAGDTLDSSLPVGLKGSTAIANASTNALTVAGTISSATAPAKTISNTGAGAGAVTFSGTIADGSGQVGITQNSTTSPLILAGSNTFSGALTVNNGTTLRLAHANAVSTGGLTMKGGSAVLDTAVTLGKLTFTNSPGATVSGFTLNFTAGGSISTDKNDVNQTITSGITGNPTVRVNRGPSGGAYQGLIFAPSSGTQTLGVVYLPDDLGGSNDKAGVYLSGSTIGNSASSVTFTNASWRYGTLYKQGSGRWTVGNVDVGTVSISAGDLVANGTIHTYYNMLQLSGSGVLHCNNPGAVYNDLRISGGALDNSSGAAITTSTYNPIQTWSGNWTFIGSQGTNSDIYLGTGAVTISGATRQVTVQNAAATLTVGGIISGAGLGVTKAGPGTLALTGANAYTGATTINAGGGTLQLGNGGAAGTLNTGSAISVGSGAAFAVKRSNTVTQGTDFNGAGISGAGGFRQAGGGTTVLNANNSYGGLTDVQAGTLRLNRSGGTIADAAPVQVSGGTLDVAQADTVGAVTLSSGLISGAGVLTGSSYALTGSGTISASLGANAAALTKSGAGTATLTAANSYSGGTTVGGGTLAVSGGGTLGSGNVAVNGGTLQLGVSTAIADSATLTIADGATADLAGGVNETVNMLFLGPAQALRGTWGSSASAATYKDDAHFTGTGTITVLSGPPTTIIMFQ